MSFIKNIFSSKPSTEELISRVGVTIVEAMQKAKKAESRKRPAKKLREPEQEPKKPAKEPKRRRVEAAEPTPAPTVEAIPADVKPADVKPADVKLDVIKPPEVKPAIIQEPVLLTSKTEPSILALLTEREVASLSAEETKRKQEEADQALRTLVMNSVRLAEQTNQQQAIAAKADALLSVITGQVVPSATRKPKSKPKKKKKPSTEPPRVTCSAMTTKGKRCRRKPSEGSTKCSEHDGTVIQTQTRPTPKPKPATRPPPPSNRPSRPILDEEFDSDDEGSDFVEGSDIDV